MSTNKFKDFNTDQTTYILKTNYNHSLWNLTITYAYTLIHYMSFITSWHSKVFFFISLFGYINIISKDKGWA